MLKDSLFRKLVFVDGFVDLISPPEELLDFGIRSIDWVTPIEGILVSGIGYVDLS